MTREQLESRVAKKSEENGEFVEKEKKKFIKNFLKDAKQEFENYEKGYKIFSITTGKPTYFTLDDKMVTEIANNLRNLYDCKLLSVSQTSSPRLYTLTFEK